ncbi:hypothetical protein QET93_001770 [Akkermansia sp. N21116]|nr:hypothetical protein [Akkermansia sp. N21116]WPX40830.1 hypothetical protein QET93_001770 [Akkermansia sp. N21116]
MPLFADSIAQGILLPKKEMHAISFAPKNVADIFIIDVLPQGAKVKQGQAIASSDFRSLDRLIEDMDRYVKARNLDVLKLRFELEQEKATANQKNKEATLSLQRAQEDLKDFQEKRKARMLAEEEERVNKALRQLSYKQEELNQLVKMYKEDQVAEETEEIILTRLKNELSESDFAVQGAKLTSELAKLRTINRYGEDLQKNIDQWDLEAKSVAAKYKFSVEQKQLALTDAEVALKRAQDRLNDLQKDRAMAQFQSPADGILLYGGYVGDKWVANSVALKLRPGGKLEPFDKIATIVPPDSELIIQAVLPDSTPTPKVGDQVIVKITNKQLPGTVTVADPIPDADGKRRIIITPQAPAAEIFAPGLPVQVIIKDQQA